MKCEKLIVLLAVGGLMVGNAAADTIISIKPEFSLLSDGKAIIANAQQYCSDATYVFVDTTTASGKAMYSFALMANATEKAIYLQTGCTCNVNCSTVGVVPVYKMCSILINGACP